MSDIRYRLTRPQWQVFRNKSRFRCLNAGRRFGKTFLACVELFVRAQNKPKSVNWYIAPTYRQAEQIAWANLKKLIPPGYIQSKNETDLRINLRNGSIIALRGSDNPDSLRGVGLDFVVIDEAAFQDRDTWTEAVRPALSDREGAALFISTPCGYNWFYDLYIAASSKADWQVFEFTTLEGGNVPLSEIEAARADLDELTFRQEYEASFETLSGRVYYAYDRKLNITETVDDGISPMLVGMDFNVNPMSAVFAIRKADQLHIIGEHTIQNGNTDDMASYIKTKYQGRKVNIYPDPTGNARKTSAPVGETDFTILRRHGFTVLAPGHPYPVADKINTVNAGFKTAAGVSKIFINSAKCPQLCKAFDGLTYREGTKDIDKSLGLDHITDAAGYLILWELPLRGSSGGVRVGAA